MAVLERRRVALFGGTFDPIHQGHLEIARRAVEDVGLDEVVFLPCRQSPHKVEAAGASGEQRCAMLRLATEGISWARVDDWELRQEGANYSWKTAEWFKGALPGCRLYWLMGADQWKVVNEWARADYLASLVTFLVHDRQGSLGEGEFEAIFLRGEHPASASEIRDLIGRGEAVPGGWLDGSVAQFVSSESLYRH
ncbi:MAG: nicotinate (nicotinamide) nucleotide adenylyltransferase [Verrucomicrobiota bacterium]